MTTAPFPRGRLPFTRCRRSALVRGGAIAAFLLETAGLISAAEPTLTHVHPAGVQRGTEVDAKFAGKFDPWPCRVWADAPGISFTAGEKAGNFRVRVAAEVPAGPHLVRAFNEEGASMPVVVVVDEAAQTADTEPNDAFRAPQGVDTLPAVINGRHEKADDVDSFAVALKKGETLVAWVEAYVLAAGFDPLLRVVDERGVVHAFNHDDVTLDPFLAFTAPADGRWIVQTMGHKYPASTDVRFAAGEDCIYRMHLTTTPFVRHTWPLRVPAGRSMVALHGWNLRERETEVDSAAPPAFPVVFAESPQFVVGAAPASLPVPCGFSGHLTPEAPEAVVSFTPAKDVPYTLRATAREFGSRIDAWLAIRNPEGKEVARADDTGGTMEPTLTWTPTVDGTFTAVVGDVTHRTGDNCHFHLEISPALPSVSATVVHALKVEAGKSESVKVNVTFAHGFSKKLKLAAADLPPGVTAAEVDVPEKGGEVALPVNAEATAPAASQPFRLILREVDTGVTHPVVTVLTSTSENNGVPQGYQKLLVESTPQLWLTVVAAPPPAPPAEPAKAPQ